MTINDIITDNPDIFKCVNPKIEPLGGGRFLAAGEARLDDLSEETGVDLCAEGLDTIGGLIFNLHGSLPRQGEVVEIEKIRFTVQRVSRKRIHELLAEAPEEVAE